MHERVYRLLLRFYPAPFRRTHGDEALLLFRDRLRDEAGFLRRVRLWVDLLTDFGAIRLRGYRELPLAHAVAVSGNGVPSFGSLEEGHLQARSLWWGGVLSVVLCGSVLFALEHGRGHLPRNVVIPPSATQDVSKLRAHVELTYEPLDSSKRPMVRLRAVVHASDGGPTPTGKVNFLYGWRTLTSAALDDGSIVVDAKLPDDRKLSLDAVYLGDVNYSSANSMETP
jgi:hypothetical protein